MTATSLGTVFFVVLSLTAGCAGAPKEISLNKKKKVALLVQMAEGARVEGDYPGAFALLNRAEKLDAKFSQVHLVRALTHYSKREPKEALISAKRALKFNPKGSDENNTYGKILSDLNRTKEAKKYLSRAANDPLNRSSYLAWTNLGMIEYKNGNFSRARTKFKKAARDGKNRACVAHYYLGKLDLKKRKWNSAIQGLKRATFYECGKFGQAHLALGIAYARGKNYKAARGKFLEINELFPNSKFSRQAMRRLRKLP